MLINGIGIPKWLQDRPLLALPIMMLFYPLGLVICWGQIIAMLFNSEGGWLPNETAMKVVFAAPVLFVLSFVWPYTAFKEFRNIKKTMAG
ncbi:hypothetical protein IPG36_03225 [bacterium]|nr:MAG: hypothetical protein IPG36_03225 [bacterium]